MIGHPDADTLAACREGLLGRRRSARIRAHLARCSRCASLDHELAAVTRLLASAPAPRIPDELATRLDTVLAAESAARARGESPAADGIAAAADGVPATDGVPVTADGIPATAGTSARPADGRAAPADGQAIPGRKAGPRPGRSRSARPPRAWRVTALRAASVTAALLVIAGGGYGVSRLLSGGGGAASSSTSSQAGGSSGTRPYRNAPVAGGNSAPVSPRAGVRIPAGEIRVVHTGNDYQPGRLVTQAQALLASHTAQFGGAMIAPPRGSTLTGCVKLVAGAVHPTVVDEARYNGQPATIIIGAPAAGRPGRVWVIVPSCSAAGRQLVRTAWLPASG